VIFGAVPLVPYFLFDPSQQTFVLSVIATFSALTALGLLRWHATAERLLRTVGETVALGASCAAVAYLVGWLVGG
jgi:VIT1/CCC1 family predicted Fe2+/Mn2+ transporter